MPTIVTATDGSAAANAAVERALAEARASNATVELVGAWSAPPNGALGAPTYMSEEVYYAGREAISKILDEAKARAAIEICRVAERRHADLIVMGSRGHKPLAAALLGSVATHVVRNAHCPVMIVPDPARD